MRKLFPILLYPTLIVVSPLLGIWLKGEPLIPYLDFPPHTRPTQPKPFSWLAFLVIGLFVGACIAPFIAKLIRVNRRVILKSPETNRFPFWGWLGFAFLTLAWLLAWNRFAWFQPFQQHTFTPLWIGYIVIMNALSVQRTGRCMMLERPRFFLLLFPLSALFWWGFEFLNRFVGNWYYASIDELGPLEYFLQASLPFSTVLPAVLSTAEWLESYPRLSLGLGRFWRIHTNLSPMHGWLTLTAGSAALVGIAMFPDVLYPLLWLAPLCIISGLQKISGTEPLLFTTLTTGDWRRLWIMAIAGLICGFFWELWNSQSLAHWEYSVSYVQRFKLFAMPLLGYAGYLPFGLACAAFASCLEETPARAG
jgi:hypothetical protein